MAGSAKFASDDMKAMGASRAQTVASGTPGPTGMLADLEQYLPQPLPTEAWGLWNKDGYLFAASSLDGMNAWYLHVDAEELPHYSTQVFTGEDNEGNRISVDEGESAIMASFIQGQIPYFFINGERFTQSANRDPEGHSYFVMCTGTNGRGAMVHFDSAGHGASIHFYTSGKPVGTEERMGLPKTITTFDAPPVDPRTLPSVVGAYANETYAPFWAVTPAE